MKILLCSPIYPPEVDETAQYSRAVALTLQKAGHSVTVVTYANHPVQDDGLKIFSTKKSWPTLVRLFLYMLRLLWLVPRYDVVYVQEVIASGFPAAWIARFFRKKVIIHVHVDELWKRSHTYNAVENRRKKIVRFVLRRASTVVTSSQALQDCIVKTYGVEATRCQVVYDPLLQSYTFPFILENNIRKISISCTPDKESQCRQAIGDTYEVIFLQQLPLVEQQYHIQTSLAYIALASDDLRPNDAYSALQHNIPLIVMNTHPAIELVKNTDACVIDTIEQIPAVLDRIAAHGGCNAKADVMDWQVHVQSLEKVLSL